MTELFENAGFTPPISSNFSIVDDLDNAEMMLDLFGQTGGNGVTTAPFGEGWALPSPGDSSSGLATYFRPSYRADPGLGPGVPSGRAVSPNGGSILADPFASSTGTWLLRSAVVIPEPNTALLLGLGLVTLTVRARGRKP